MTPHYAARPPLGDLTLSRHQHQAHDRKMRPLLHQMLKSSRILKLSVETTFSAAILLHRYIITVETNLPIDTWIITVCLLLASKREEEPRRLRDFINCSYLMQNRPLPDLNDAYWEDKKHIVRTEQIVLRWLDFDLMVSRPHRAVVALLLPFSSTDDCDNSPCKEMARGAFRILNCTIFSIEALQQEGDILAVAALRLALIESDTLTTAIPEEKRQQYLSLQIWNKQFGMQIPAESILRVQGIVKRATTAEYQHTQHTAS